MIGVPLTLFVHALCAALCIVGFELIGGRHAKLGYVLSALGSIGWLIASDSLFFKAQSLFFFWIAARGFERTRRISGE
jgi:hypothetical protein